MSNIEKRRWWVLGALSFSLMAVGLDLTVLNVALPTLSTELHASISELQWFVNSYNLVLAAMLLPAGMLGDRLGRKKLLLGALLLFGIASVACAYSDTPQTLIIMRTVLGLAAAFLIPLSLSTLPVLFSGAERTKAMMIWAVANMLGIPLGPIVGGWLLQHYSWGSVFLINIPFVIIGLISVFLLLPESRSSNPLRIDVLGILSSSLGLIGITYGVIRAGERGWGDSVALITLIAGLLILALFILWQRRTNHALIDLTLFRSANFTWGSILATMVTFAIFGLLFTMPQYFQAIGGADAFKTGLRLLPLIGGLIIGARAANQLIKKIGSKNTASMGFLFISAGLIIGTATHVDSSYMYAAIWFSIAGLGIGFALPTMMDSALGELSAERSGVGSALIMAMRQVGGAIGVALLGAVLNSVYRNQLDLSGLPDSAAETVKQSVSAGVAIANKLDSQALLSSVHFSFVHGMTVMLWVCAGISLLGIVLAQAFLPRHSASQDTGQSV